MKSTYGISNYSRKVRHSNYHQSHNQGQSFLETEVVHLLPPLNEAPDIKIKTGLERFIFKWGRDWNKNG